MTKLNRVTGKVFGATASPTGDVNNGAYIGQFGSAQAGTFNGTSDIATIQSLSAWDNGWTDAVVETDHLPPLPERTGVDKVLSYQECYLLQQGIPEYDAGTIYYKGCLAKNINDTNITQYKSITDSNLGNALTDTNNWQDITPLNHSQISNSIIQAPNGVGSFSGDTITINEGVNILIPNGLNPDNTNKNINFTLGANWTFTNTINTLGDYVLFANTTNLSAFKSDYIRYYEYSKELPTPAVGLYIRAFVSSENLWYTTTNGSAYTTNNFCIIGNYGTNNGNYNYRYVNLHFPTKVLSKTDSNEICGWSFPSTRVIALTVGASGSSYTAPANGYVYASVVSNDGNRATVALKGNNIQSSDHSYTGGTRISVTIPVERGENFIYSYENVTQSLFGFVYAGGEL